MDLTDQEIWYLTTLGYAALVEEFTALGLDRKDVRFPHILTGRAARAASAPARYPAAYAAIQRVLRPLAGARSFSVTTGNARRGRSRTFTGVVPVIEQRTEHGATFDYAELLVFGDHLTDMRAFRLSRGMTARWTITTEIDCTVMGTSFGLGNLARGDRTLADLFATELDRFAASSDGPTPQ